MGAITNMAMLAVLKEQNERGKCCPVKVAAFLPDKPAQRVQHLYISIGIHILPYLTVNTPNRIFYTYHLYNLLQECPGYSSSFKNVIVAV